MSDGLHRYESVFSGLTCITQPSSRIFLIGEQPNPWDLLQPRDKMSRHRGAELRRRYGRLGGTSLFNVFHIRLYLHPAPFAKGAGDGVLHHATSAMPDAIASSRYGVTS